MPGSSSVITTQLRADLAVRGARADLTQAPVRRRSGAGPSDDGHVLIGGIGTAVPMSPDSPYAVSGGRLLFEGADTGVEIEPVTRPRFYDLTTEDGTSYEQIARLHGSNVLASTVVQTCMRYEKSQRCKFCAIEASLAAGSTTAVKSPAQLAEVAEAAVRLDGITQVVLTTGTTKGSDRGAKHLARCVKAILEKVPGLPIQVQCEPPEDLASIADLKAAGAHSIGVHIESLDQAVRNRWMPGKATVPVEAYWATWREAVRLFGRNRVSTYLLVGLGESPDELIAGCAELIDAGVYPFVVPFRPLVGTLAEHEPAPDSELLLTVTTAVAGILARAGMRGADQGAGCAACGACSALAVAGG
jgi:radical SAM protein (TIGR04043 family)